MLNDYLSVSEAAERRAVTTRTIRRWCADGWIDGARRVGSRAWLIPRDALDAFTPPSPGRQPMAEWYVLDGARVVATVQRAHTMTAEDVRRSLIDHDGMPDSITVQNVDADT